MNRSLPTFDEAEQRNKLSHITCQGYDIKGIIQGGANDGEEYENAMRLGVEHYIAFEPLKSAFDKLVKIPVPAGYDYKCYQEGLGNVNRPMLLNVTAIDGKGSSLFDAEWEHPEVLKNWNQGQSAVVGQEVVTIWRFSDWLTNHKEVDLSLYDTLQLDCEGSEMNILLGMEDLIKHFKYLCIEMSETLIYKGGSTAAEIIEYLEGKGFILDSPIYSHNDTYLIRSDIKNVSDRVYRGRA